MITLPCGVPITFQLSRDLCPVGNLFSPPLPSHTIPRSIPLNCLLLLFSEDKESIYSEWKSINLPSFLPSPEFLRVPNP